MTWLLSILLWVSAAYFFILPLTRSRGPYGWGHFRLIDIYFGVPLTLLSLCATLYLVNRRYRRSALRLTAVIISSLLTLFVLDFAYAVALQSATKNIARTDFWFIQGWLDRENNLPDEELGFVRKPRLVWQGQPTPNGRSITYRTDEQGFRNQSDIHQADVAFIGDSFTEGGSVSEEDTFVQRTGNLTRRSVVNLGRGMYGPQQELIVLKKYGLGYSPRVIVWQLFEGNDLQDAARFAAWKKSPIPNETLAQRYLWHSLLVHWLDRTLPKDLPVPQSIAGPTLATGKVNLDYRYDPNAPETEANGFAETKVAIEEGYRICQAHGIKLVVIFVPVKVRVLASQITFDDSQQRQRYLPGGVTDSDHDFDHQIGKYCQQIGCAFVDLTPQLRDEARRDPRFLYMLNQDSHLDVDGHRVVAETVAEWLRSNAN